MKQIVMVLGALVLAVAGSGGSVAHASSASGQVMHGQTAVEPAYDGMTGSEIFLQIPAHAAVSPGEAWTPLYLPVYPTTSTIPTFDCTPDNCDHVNVLPAALVTAFGLQAVYPLGQINTHYGPYQGGLVKGHDHVTGPGDTGSGSPVTRHVYLVLFTAQGASDGAINTELTTVWAMNAAIARGDALAPIDTGIIIHAARVSGASFTG